MKRMIDTELIEILNIIKDGTPANIEKLLKLTPDEETGGYKTPYTYQEVEKLVKKYNVVGFTYLNSDVLFAVGHITYLRENDTIVIQIAIPSIDIDNPKPFNLGIIATFYIRKVNENDVVIEFTSDIG